MNIDRLIGEEIIYKHSIRSNSIYIKNQIFDLSKLFELFQPNQYRKVYFRNCKLSNDQKVRVTDLFELINMRDCECHDFDFNYCFKLGLQAWIPAYLSDKNCFISLLSGSANCWYPRTTKVKKKKKENPMPLSKFIPQKGIGHEKWRKS